MSRVTTCDGWIVKPVNRQIQNMSHSIRQLTSLAPPRCPAGGDEKLFSSCDPPPTAEFAEMLSECVEGQILSP